MLQRQAEELLAGAPLVVATEGAAGTVRALMAQLLERDVPAVLGPCPKGG
jgi:hypothetical protein